MGLHVDAAPALESPVGEPASRRRAALRWTWRHPRATGYGLAAVLMGCFVAAMVSSTEHWTPSTSGLPPNQAGYLWCCGATDVGASWTVPRLAPQSHQAAAEGVWIGLQTNSGDFFLQVGTQDNLSNLSSQYQAFWSDGPLHGAPVDLGNVNPGDLVQARLVESGTSQWVITFQDQTLHWTRTREISYPAHYAHALAEWIEEDPAELVPFQKARLFTMARTNGTLVHDLEVNGAVPVTSELAPESFVDGAGMTFSPSLLQHGEFHFVPW